MKEYVIDSHSHIGKDIFHGVSDIDGYLDFAKKSGINVGILMGVPSPCKELGNPNSRLAYWKYDGTKMQYFGSNNPYESLNYELNETITKKSNNDVKLLFAPIFHPVLDDVDTFETMLFKTDPVAIKIHGIGCGVGPNDINKDFIDLFKQLNIPFIVHTDCDFGKGSQSMQYVRNINRGVLWAKFFDDNQIKGILNHGSSLDIEAFDIVNKSKYLKIALGPDKVACIDRNRLYIDCLKDYKNYLMYLKKHLDISKIVYDSDYNWNLISGEEIDYDSVVRVREIFNDEIESEKVLSENLLEFNPKIIKKIRM